MVGGVLGRRQSGAGVISTLSFDIQPAIEYGALHNSK